MGRIETTMLPETHAVLGLLEGGFGHLKVLVVGDLMLDRYILGEVERISATVEQSRREVELAEKLAAVERELGEVKAASTQNALSPLRSQPSEVKS